MKNAYSKLFVLCVGICLTSFFVCTACNKQNNITLYTEEVMKEYYTIEDFNSIVIGESTFQDVFKIAPNQTMNITSYGGLCEYPKQDGGKIQIKFCGNNLIVHDISEYD